MPQPDPIDKFGYAIGETGEIKIEIDANPKPQIEWQIDGQRIREGANDNTGRIEAEMAKDLVYSLLIINLAKLSIHALLNRV